MATLEQLGKVVETDLLVVGFGIAGLSAAIVAKEEEPGLKVLAVDKGCVGYAGKANKGGGHVAFIPEGGEEAYVEYHTKNCGDYLNDQDQLRTYAHSTIKTMDRWARWGVKFIGREHAAPAHPMIPWKICLVDSDMMIPMGTHAKKLGVEFKEKVTITDLLKDGDRVVGAFGFSLLTGQALIFKAKAVLLANGDQGFRIMRMWNSARGDGIAAAWRAGAKMRNAEFGSFVNLMSAEHKMVSYGAENALYNARGAKATERADLDPRLKAAVGGVDLGGSQSVLMYMEVREGRGPIYEDTKENDFVTSWIGRNFAPEVGVPDPPFRRPVCEKFWHRLWEKNKQGGYRDDSVRKEVIPGVVGECSPLYANHDYSTSLPGLFAAGDICGNGGAWTGAVPTPPGRNRGSGYMHAVMTAITAATSAVKHIAANAASPRIDVEQVAKLKEEVFAPLKRTSGVTTAEIVSGVGEAMQPVAYSGYKSEDRMQEALKRVLALRAKLPRLVARDPHDLSAANECRSMVLCAEMFYRASLARKESRGWHMREDYRDRDDKNFLKWIVLRQGKDGEMELSFEPLPMERYKYRPG